MANGVRFLHLADVHVGFRVTRFEEGVAKKLREARFQALDNALRLAEEKNADLIVISGDLFDDNGVSGRDAQRVYDMLKGRPMPVFVLPGNHDPYCAGSVWDRHPWNETQGTAIHVLRSAEPVPIGEDVSLHPCPVTHRTSREDPTEWIRSRKPGEGIRIGVAHGSVMDRATLPEDDHPIPVDAAARRQLDYLALGHWHQPKGYPDADGASRMVYPGTLEQMAFATGSGFAVGWAAYAPAAEREEFAGSAKGQALFVRIASPGAVPIVEAADTGQYVWTDETVELADDADFGKVFGNIATRASPERCLLRLKLKGLLGAESILKLDGFRDMLNRYMYCDLSVDELYLAPKDESVEAAVGHGVVGEVLKRVKEILESDPSHEERLRAQRAVLLLYRLAQEVKR